MEEEPVSAIRFEQVSLQFPTPRLAVNDCSLQVEAGQLVVILGPSGCGKTTLLKMVNRLYEPTAGKIYLDGTEVRQMKVTELRQQMAMSFSSLACFHDGCSNIAVVPKLLGWSRAKIQPCVDELLTLIKRPMNTAIATLAAIRRSAAGAD